MTSRKSVISDSSDCESCNIYKVNDCEFTSIKDFNNLSHNKTRTSDLQDVDGIIYDTATAGKLYIVGSQIHTNKIVDRSTPTRISNPKLAKWAVINQITYNKSYDPIEIIGTYDCESPKPPFNIHISGETIQQMMLGFVIFIRNLGLCVLFLEGSITPTEFLIMLTRTGINRSHGTRTSTLYDNPTFNKLIPNAIICKNTHTKFNKYIQKAELLHCTLDDAISKSVFANINVLANMFQTELSCVNAAIGCSDDAHIIPTRASPNKFVITGTHKHVIIIDFKSFYPNIVLEN